MTRSVDCPTCMKTVPWTIDSQYRPFCSQRCKLIDLGDWAAGKNTIAGEPVTSHEDEQSQSDPGDFLGY